MDLFSNNKLKQLIADYSLRGMTSNPSIFDKAIAESSDYDEDIKRMSRDGKDINDAADEF